MTNETMRIARGLMDVERRRLERHMQEAQGTGCEILTSWCWKSLDVLDECVRQVDDALVKGRVDIEA